MIRQKSTIHKQMWRFIIYIIGWLFDVRQYDLTRRLHLDGLTVASMKASYYMKIQWLNDYYGWNTIIIFPLKSTRRHHVDKK